MSLNDLTVEAVNSAIQEFDGLTRDAFLARYGFKPARSYFLIHDGRRYDSKAIAGAAHGYLTGEAPLKAPKFNGGEKTVATALRRLGFDVVNNSEDTVRNPAWSRDELILALDVYMRFRPTIPGKTSKPITDLSGVLNLLVRQSGGQGNTEFRNPNGVYMKLMNLRRFDPDVAAAGRVGLQRGNKDEEVVWNIFAGDPARLAKVADAIRAELVGGEDIGLDQEVEEGFVEAAEGRVLTRLHRTRERNRKLVETRKKRTLQQTGKLVCEVCDFDFALRYGARGVGFIEAHHTRPVHTLNEGSKTRIQDLALLCSNCHRMIHASRDWLSIDELRTIVARSATLPEVAKMPD